MGLAEEGTITFVLEHEHQDWPTNDQGYKFGTIDTGQGVKAGAVKNPDKTLELRVSGPFGRQFHFHRPIPPCDERGLTVAITWKEPEVKLYLNGQEVETQNISGSADPTSDW